MIDPGRSVSWTAKALPAMVPLLAADLTETVNTLVDNLVETGNRLLEVPLVVLLAIVGVVAVLLVLLMHRLFGKRGGVRVFRIILVVVVILALFAVAYVVDRKVVGLQDEVRQLRSKTSTDAIGLLDVVCERTANRTSFLFDAKSARVSLEKSFGDIRMLPLIYDEATDVVLVRRTDPVAQAYLAIIDLRHPTLVIRLGTNIESKTPTAEFALENHCTVAVNGEAGQSPKPDSGFGQWIGNLICQGEVILLEDTDKRPFLSFDRNNRAKYSPAAVVDRNLTPEKYNVIWGRMDVLLKGEPMLQDNRQSQPRTAMAVNADGSLLYLLVVDGRQPDYSMGFTRADAGEFLKAFGATDGMLCDQGGSSCIYLKSFGGISNVPCGRGRDRPTYTHFGITLGKSDDLLRHTAANRPRPDAVRTRTQTPTSLDSDEDE